jgi:predicted dehydrogenase
MPLLYLLNLICMKRIAVVGFGFMGFTHVLNILKIPGLKLQAIVDPDTEVIEKNLNSSTGNFSTGTIDPSDLKKIGKYTSLDECLHHEELNAVSICTHVNSHYKMTRKALLNDKHVFLEKPFCLDIQQAQELTELARRRNKVLMVGHVVRFMSPYIKLKNWVESGEFGELKFLVLSRFCGIPRWGQWKEKKVRDLSGGALFDLVIHDIDYANYLLGMPPEINCNYLPGEFSPHDYISAMWHYPDRDMHVKIEGGFTFHAAFPFQASFMARFDKASILYSTLKGEVINIADNEKVREIPANDGGDGYFNEIEYFARCIESNITPEICPPESSLQAIQLCYKHLK